jgi:hypothetical protein
MTTNSISLGDTILVRTPNRRAHTHHADEYDWNALARLQFGNDDDYSVFTVGGSQQQHTARITSSGGVVPTSHQDPFYIVDSDDDMDTVIGRHLMRQRAELDNDDDENLRHGIDQILHSIDELRIAGIVDEHGETVSTDISTHDTNRHTTARGHRCF